MTTPELVSDDQPNFRKGYKFPQWKDGMEQCWKLDENHIATEERVIELNKEKTE